MNEINHDSVNDIADVLNRVIPELISIRDDEDARPIDRVQACMLLIEMSRKLEDVVK